MPILGVNVGQLGYLTALEPDELEPALPALARGRLRRLGAHDARGRVRPPPAACAREFALNEAVLEKREAGHLIRFDLSINGSAFTTYAADGVIVATPTGTHRVLVLGARARSCRPRCAASCSRRSRRTCCSTGRSCSPTHEELDFVVAGGREVVAARSTVASVGELARGRSRHLPRRRRTAAPRAAAAARLPPDPQGEVRPPGPLMLRRAARREPRHHRGDPASRSGRA